MRFQECRGSLGLFVALAFGLVACANDGGDDGSAAGASFALESCDSADQCAAGFECAVFPCPADCEADTDGRCDTCQAGAICLPQPSTECDPEQCGPGQVCQRTCSGACDLAVGQCTDVACQVACLPVGTPTEPDPDQACVTDFTDACLPPDYPVAARLDDVCAAQGLVLTDVSVAAECWPGAVQFKWTCCRGEGEPTPEPWCERNCTDDGQCYERCCDPVTGECWGNETPTEPTCRTECFEDGVCSETCCDPVTGQCWTTDPNQPQPCYVECDAAGQCYDVCCDATTGECWGGQPQEPYCYVECDQTDPDGPCYDVCCDPTTGQCWGGGEPQPPTEVCVQGAFEECLPGVDPKMRAYEDCAAQNLELRDLYEIGACADGTPMFAWTCCGGGVTPPPGPTCEKQCDANVPGGACVEVCCDPTTGQCWTNGGTDPQPQCWKECKEDGTCYETCCDANGQCWTNGLDQPPTDPTACQKACDSTGTCTETCCDAAGTCWTTTYPVEPPPPTDPAVCIGQMAGGAGTCTDLETLLAYASWTCAASGLTLTDSSPWGECDGGFSGLKFACCGVQP